MSRWISEAQWESLAVERTDAHRVCTHDRGWMDRYGDWVVETVAPGAPGWPEARDVARRFGFTPRGWLLREWSREHLPARLVDGEAPAEIEVREDGVAFLVEPGGGYSTGLFLDQRLNRRWAAGLHPRRVLNLFSYTCSFSVRAALTGAETLNVDAARRPLERGRENFRRNGVAMDGHRFVVEDVMKFVPRLVRRRERFDLIILDPPTFGRSEGRVFRLERDLPDLVTNCARLLEQGGAMLVSCNYARWSRETLRDVCGAAVPAGEFAFEPGALPPEIPRGAISWRLTRPPGVNDVRWSSP